MKHRRTTAAVSLRLFFAGFFILCPGLWAGGGSFLAQETIPAGESPATSVVGGTAPETIPAAAAEAISGSPSVEIPGPSEETRFPPLPAAREGVGAESWYYEAKKLEQSGEAASEAAGVAAGNTAAAAALSIDFMYSLAFHFGEKAAAKEAGRALLQRSVESASPAAAKTIASQWLDYFGPDWDIYKTLVAACIETGDFPRAIETIAALRRALPSAAKTRANELAFYEYSAKASLEDFSWLKPSLSYLNAYSLDSWSAKILRLAASAPEIEVETRELCLMRADFQEKNYTQAAQHAAGARGILHEAGTARFLISEAGKSFINAGAKDEGIAFFTEYFPATQEDAASAFDLPDRIVTALGTMKSEESLWVAAYYLARLWQSADREREAAILFLGLTDSAPSDADADGALWYWLDITMRRIADDDIAAFGARRSLEFGALVEASARWQNPAYFDDIVESYDRSLLKEKSWDDVLSLLILIGDKISPGMRTRLLYQGGRLVEENLARRAATEPFEPAESHESAEPSGRNIAEEYFRKILENPDAEEYYRTMSAWRLGLEPTYLKAMPDLAVDAPGATSLTISALTANTAAAANGNGIQSALSLIRNYLVYDLDEMASVLAMNYIGNLDKSLIAGLAFDLSSEGQHYAALRLARDAVNRGAGAQYPELYGLVYPKAWNDIVAEGAAIPGIPEALAYGIIRSESVFDPKAVSYAGAVGLTQLMPATAAETARGLKMPGYSLTDPSDNLRIGLTYYSYMLARFDGKPMRAIFAYNAGPGRMTTWAKESGELPDDLLLETLHLAQPRQYAKNIIQATLAYGKIHYGLAPLALLDYLVDARPLEAEPRGSVAETVAAEVVAQEETFPERDQGSSIEDPEVTHGMTM